MRALCTKSRLSPHFSGFGPLPLLNVVTVVLAVVVLDGVGRVVTVVVVVEALVVDTGVGTRVVDGGGGAVVVGAGSFAGADGLERDTADAGSLRAVVAVVSVEAAPTVFDATVDVGSGKRSSRSESTCAAGDSAARERDIADGGGSR